MRSVYRADLDIWSRDHRREYRGDGLRAFRVICKGKEMHYRAAETPLAQKLHHAMEEIMDISCPRK